MLYYVSSYDIEKESIRLSLPILSEFHIKYLAMRYFAHYYGMNFLSDDRYIIVYNQHNPEIYRVEVRDFDPITGLKY